MNIDHELIHKMLEPYELFLTIDDFKKLFSMKNPNYYYYRNRGDTPKYFRRRRIVIFLKEDIFTYIVEELKSGRKQLVEKGGRLLLRRIYCSTKRVCKPYDRRGPRGPYKKRKSKK